MRSAVLPSIIAVRLYIACIVMFFTASCATTPGKQSMFFSRHEAACSTESGKPIDQNPLYVVVDDHGRLGDRNSQIVELKKALDKFKTGGERKDREAKKRTIFIFVHGGLTTQESAKRLANIISREMKEEGYLPLFLIWNTGGLEAYWEQSAYVRDGWRYEEFRLGAPLHWIADLGQGIVRAPLIYVKQLQRVNERREASPTYGWVLMNKEEHYKGGEVTAQNNLVFAEETEEDQKRSPDFLEYFSYLSTFPFRTLASPPLDGLGKSAWENMVRRARTTVHQTPELDPECREEISRKMGMSSELASKKHSLGLGGFSEVFNALDEWLQANDLEREFFRITLVGHSMGAIVLNELIRTYNDILYDDIVYMGAAASIRDLNRVIVPYLRRHRSARFYNLMLHPHNEAWELTWGGILPSGSLLEWIDEMYEPPETMLDRTLGKWRNLKVAKDTVDSDAQKHMLFKVFGVNSKDREKPRKHGEFNDPDTCFWNPWFWVNDNFEWAMWNRPQGKNSEQETPPNRGGDDFNSGQRDWNPPEKSSLLACQGKMKRRLAEEPARTDGGGDAIGQPVR